jgi:uncharacterized protein YndB with AHSA1/START domain
MSLPAMPVRVFGDPPAGKLEPATTKGGCPMAMAVAEASVVVDADRGRVWEALTSPDLIREYFLGATVTTDWKVGSPITFTGDWKGKPYEDKGEIITFEPDKELSYSHWSQLSGTDDVPENYHVVDIALDEADGGTTVTLTQSNLDGGITESDRANRDDYEQNWKMMLQGLKKTVEARG